MQNTSDQSSQKADGKTVAVGFGHYASLRKNLYSVVKGTSAKTAIGEASTLIASAIAIINQNEGAPDVNATYGVTALLEQVQGLINAVDLGFPAQRNLQVAKKRNQVIVCDLRLR